jgi:hypothetical protein
VDICETDQGNGYIRVDICKTDQGNGYIHVNIGKPYVEVEPMAFVFLVLSPRANLYTKKYRLLLRFFCFPS